MELQLKPETQAYIDLQVKSGRFTSRETLIEAAVDTFRAIYETELDTETMRAMNEGLLQAQRGEGMELSAFRASFFSK